MEQVQHALAKLRDDVFKIEVEVLEGGKMPSKAHATDAGWDLYATDDITIYPGQVLKHPLNIRIALPCNSWAEIASKSGLGSKGILVYAGVIDQGYRGIPHIVFTNLKHTTETGEINKTPVVIKKGEKLAQLIMNPYSENYFMVQVEKVDTNTDRSTGGFGSSGR